MYTPWNQHFGTWTWMVGSWNTTWPLLLGFGLSSGTFAVSIRVRVTEKKGQQENSSYNKETKKLRGSEIHPPKKIKKSIAKSWAFRVFFLTFKNGSTLFGWGGFNWIFQKVWLVWIFQKVWCEKKTGVWKCINWCNHPQVTIHRLSPNSML